MNVALPGKRSMAELVSAFLDQKLRKGADKSRGYLHMHSADRRLYG